MSLAIGDFGKVERWRWKEGRYIQSDKTMNTQMIVTSQTAAGSSLPLIETVNSVHQMEAVNFPV